MISTGCTDDRQTIFSCSADSLENVTESLQDDGSDFVHGYLILLTMPASS